MNQIPFNLSYTSNRNWKTYGLSHHRILIIGVPFITGEHLQAREEIKKSCCCSAAKWPSGAGAGRTAGAGPPLVDSSRTWTSLGPLLQTREKNLLLWSRRSVPSGKFSRGASKQASSISFTVRLPPVHLCWCSLGRKVLWVTACIKTPNSVLNSKLHLSIGRLHYNIQIEISSSAFPIDQLNSKDNIKWSLLFE